MQQKLLGLVRLLYTGAVEAEISHRHPQCMVDPDQFVMQFGIGIKF